MKPLLCLQISLQELLEILKYIYLLNIKKKGRKDSCARIFALETQLEKARAENNRLIQIIIKAAQLMTEDAIDPRRYFGDATT